METLPEFNHKMLQEIREEPQAVKNTLTQGIQTVKKISEKIRTSGTEFLYLTGSGTSYHAGLACHYTLFSQDIISSSLIPASEFSQWIPDKVTRKSMLLAISQSGESFDVLQAVSTAQGRGIKVIALTNTANSTLSQKSRYPLITRAGKEQAVTATKSYVSQLALLYLFSLELASRTRLESLTRQLLEAPNLINETIRSTDKLMHEIAEKHSEARFFFILGSGADYPSALETALKLKESCNIYAEGFANREFLHGPIQLVNEKTPVIIFDNGKSEEMIGVIRSLKRFKAPVIAVSRSPEVIEAVDDYVSVPRYPEILSPLLDIVPIQLFAYYSSVARGLNPDSPEKLSKVVEK